MIFDPSANLMNELVDVNYFNKLVTNGGGKPLSTKKNNMPMSEFIFNLVKVFRTKYDLKYKKGGYDNISKYMSYPELSFGSYIIEPELSIVRDVL